MNRWRFVGALAVLSLAWVPLAAGEKGAGQFEVTVPRKDDLVKVLAAKGKVTFDITSPFGISRAVIERKGERWPAEVVVRLRLKGLENFKAQSGKVTLQAAVSVSEGKTKVRLWKGDKDTEVLPRTDPLWMEVRAVGADGKPARELPLKGGHFELTLPRALLADNPRTLTLQWIDFYR
jgi:hypothetical protein